MNKISAQDRSALIRLASSLPAGSPERRTILASLAKLLLPQELRDTPPNVPNKGTDLNIWTYEQAGKFVALAFQGKASKPLFYEVYRTEDAMNRRVQDAIESRKSALERKDLARKERADYQHNIQIGDILYSSWGYDQTNIDFYEVVAVSGKAVAIREIGSRVVSDDGLHEKVVPMRGKYTGPVLKKIPSKGYGGKPSIRLNSYSFAYPWDGKPKTQDGPYGGH